MQWKWAPVAIMTALMALTATVGGAPRAAVAAVPPECMVEFAVLGGCPTSDAPAAAQLAPASPSLVSRSSSL